MDVKIILTNISSNTVDESMAHNIDNKRCFSYVDSHLNKCQVNVTDDGICLYETAVDHSLVLNLNKDANAKIISKEGEINILLKIVDFIKKNDILLVRYQIEDETYELKIIYRS